MYSVHQSPSIYEHYSVRGALVSTRYAWRSSAFACRLFWLNGIQFSSVPISILFIPYQFSSVQFVAQSCPTFCDPMNCSMPGLPVHHQLLEFTQTHVHQVRDAIQPSHPALNPSQHQSLFQWSTLRMRCPKDWSFSFSIIPSKDLRSYLISRLLSQRI